MKFLIHSNGPMLPTGYGVQTGLLAKRLQAAGHEVAISAFVGSTPGVGSWNGIRVYPSGFDAYGNDILAHHALHWFEGDPLGGWIITLMDVFGITAPLEQFNVLAWCPVDHFPTPPDVVKFFKRSGAVPVAMSRFGEDELRRSGLDPLYAPLALDAETFLPTPTVGEHTGRHLMDVPEDAFVVMMNGMNKGWALHRKGFPHALLAFAKFAKQHPDAILYMHTEKHGGAGGYDLPKLAIASGVDECQIRFADQYAYRLGIPGNLLAAYYTAADVLLAPSMGEGFCVPLIEAQACGTPVIVTDFSAQPELVGSGSKVSGQPWWDAPQESWMISPNIEGIMAALEDAYDHRGEASPGAVALAAEYDADRVFAEYWEPILERLEPAPPVGMKPTMADVAVLVPVLSRPQNVAPLVESFDAANDGTATLYFVGDDDDDAERDAVVAAGATWLTSTDGATFAAKVNSGFRQTTESFVFLCGDDVRFHPGWLAAARPLSDRFDVIGTNDALPGQAGNATVQAGSHADHFFVRREYVDTLGGCLDGPGTVCHTYGHFYSDVETVELAKARGVFAPCLASIVEHMHPGFDKAETDDVYREGWGRHDADAATWAKRRPLVEMQRVGLGKSR